MGRKKKLRRQEKTTDKAKQRHNLKGQRHEIRLGDTGQIVPKLTNRPLNLLLLYSKAFMFQSSEIFQHDIHYTHIG